MQVHMIWPLLYCSALCQLSIFSKSMHVTYVQLWSLLLVTDQAVANNSSKQWYTAHQPRAIFCLFHAFCTDRQWPTHTGRNQPCSSCWGAGSTHWQHPVVCDRTGEKRQASQDSARYSSVAGAGLVTTSQQCRCPGLVAKSQLVYRQLEPATSSHALGTVAGKFWGYRSASLLSSTCSILAARILTAAESTQAHRNTLSKRLSSCYSLSYPKVYH